MGEVILTMKDIDKSFPGVHALDHVNFEVKRGEVHALMGENGAGKTTLSKLFCGFLEPINGKIELNGKVISPLSVKERGEHIGIVMQNPNQMISKPMIYEEVALGLTVRGVPEEEIRERVYETLKICGLYQFRNWPVSALSFGQKKRVTIASVLVQDPELIILDEPTAGLDPKERVRFRNLLSEYAGDKIVILSTHIVSDIEAIADEVLLMKKGKFVLQGTVPELIHKANGKVWELSVSPQEARQWQTKTTVANLRHEGKEIILRIISDNMPSERAVPCEATLEDLYLFYFPTEEGVK